MVNCPKCDAAIDVDEDELDEGDELTCEECGSNLTVSSLDPLELERAGDDEDDEEEEEEEEESDDFDYDEDDEEEDEDEEEEEEWH
jgi:alpha-aminoadipate/glutamate carrier protein LysW